MKTVFSLLQLRFLPVWPDLGLFALRLWLGLSMLSLHGWGKFTGFAERAQRFADPFGIGSQASLTLAVFAEVGCSALLVLGLFTRFAAFNLIATMSVAFFISHGGRLSGERSGELAFIYLAGFVMLFFSGAGRLSLDARLGGGGR